MVFDLNTIVRMNEKASIEQLAAKRRKQTDDLLRKIFFGEPCEQRECCGDMNNCTVSTSLKACDVPPETPVVIHGNVYNAIGFSHDGLVIFQDETGGSVLLTQDAVVDLVQNEKAGYQPFSEEECKNLVKNYAILYSKDGDVMRATGWDALDQLLDLGGSYSETPSELLADWYLDEKCTIPCGKKL